MPFGFEVVITDESRYTFQKGCPKNCVFQMFRNLLAFRVKGFNKRCLLYNSRFRWQFIVVLHFLICQIV